MYSKYLYTPLHSDGAGEDHVLPTVTCSVYTMYSTYLYTPLHSDGAGEDHVLSHCHVFSGSLVYVRRRNITEIKNITIFLKFLILYNTLLSFYLSVIPLPRSFHL
jgi:hypothetical protein